MEGVSLELTDYETKLRDEIAVTYAFSFAQRRRSRWNMMDPLLCYFSTTERSIDYAARTILLRLANRPQVERR